MHLIRLDIDRKNSAAHLQVGPFGGGLNAVFAPIQGGSSTMSRFVRSILFRGNYVNEVFETEEGESIDGAMQWVDSTGHVRMMSFAGGSAMLPGGFVNSPLHPSQHTLHTQDKDRIRGLGNIFWEGDDGDARWDELRGDILGMIFCSSLGSVSPEKLWWSASRLGVHSPARNELDEGYQRLKGEERDLLDRLRNADAVDHDRAWWALERDRILAELGHIAHSNHTPSQSTERANQSVVAGLRERLAMVQIELNNLRSAHQDLLVAEANAKFDIARESSSSDLEAFHNGTLNHVTLGRSRPARNAKSDWSNEILRTKNRMEQLIAEQADVEIQLQNIHVVPTVETTHRWDDAQLRQQLAHAEEMLKRWDRRTQWHRRLNEVQSHLKTRSPYRRTSEGSLIPLVEKYLRELTAGAARQLPPWAVESSYLRGHDMPIDFDGHTESGQRDVYYDRRLPSADSRQRRLVDLAMRLAIAEAAIPRIGRIPFLFDNSMELFRGEALEQVLHVLAGFARDGRQILLATNDEFVARRIAAHGGTVSRMHEILRYARPGYVMDGSSYLGIHPSIQSQPAIGYIENPYAAAHSAPSFALPYGSNDLTDINRQLSGLANEMESASWWSPLPHANGIDRSNHVRSAPVVNRPHKFQLHLDSPIQEVPTVDPSLAERFRMAGVHRVGDLIRSTADSLGECMRVESDLVHYLQCVAELMTSTPQLRPFDARVLVGCGITRSHMLRDLSPKQLVDRVANYLQSAEGNELLQTASPFEANRIREWVASVSRSGGNTFTNRSENDRSRSESGTSVLDDANEDQGRNLAFELMIREFVTHAKHVLLENFELRIEPLLHPHQTCMRQVRWWLELEHRSGSSSWTSIVPLSTHRALGQRWHPSLQSWIFEASQICSTATQSRRRIVLGNEVFRRKLLQIGRNRRFWFAAFRIFAVMTHRLSLERGFRRRKSLQIRIQSRFTNVWFSMLVARQACEYYEEQLLPIVRKLASGFTGLRTAVQFVLHK